MNLLFDGIERIALRELHAAEDLDELFAATGRLLARQFGVGAYAIYLKDRRGREFLEYASGFVHESPDGESLHASELRIRGLEFGVLRLGFADGSAAPRTEEEERLLAELSDHLAIALYFHKLIEDQSRTIDAALNHVQALKSMGELLGELDVEMLLNRLLKFFIDVLGVDVGAARLLGESGRQTEARWGLPGEVLEHIIAAAGEGMLDPLEGPVQRLTLREVELEDERRFTLGFALRISFELKESNSVEIYIVSGLPRELSPAEAELIDSCRIVAGIALQKSLDYRESIRRNRLNEQLLIARDIQADFMPDELPCPAGFQLAGKSLPALYVGGDYFDAVIQPCGNLIAIIADVSGKGIQAAMRMSAARAVFHSLASEDLGPGAMLARLNSSIYETNRKLGHFVTACCIGMDAETAKLRIAMAGHEPVLKHSGNGGAEFLELEGGLPLGLRPDQEYEEHLVELQEGESLFMHTDGIPDAANDDGIRYGVEKMVACIELHEGKSAAELLEGIFSELMKYKGEAPWSDDLTALTIERCDGGRDSWK